MKFVLIRCFYILTQPPALIIQSKGPQRDDIAGSILYVITNYVALVCTGYLALTLIPSTYLEGHAVNLEVADAR